MCWSVTKNADGRGRLVIAKRDVSARSHRSCLDMGQACLCRDVTEAMARDLPDADHRLQELLVVEQAIEDGWPTQ